MSFLTLNVGSLDVDVDETFFCCTVVRRVNVVVLVEMARSDPKKGDSFILLDTTDSFSWSSIFLVRF